MVYVDCTNIGRFPLQMSTDVNDKPQLLRTSKPTPGVKRFSASRLYKKKGGVVKRQNPQTESDAPIKKKGKFVVKRIGGDKNGSLRRVFRRKGPRYLPEGRAVRKKSAKSMVKVKHTLRPSITPGNILIVLVGRHKGKRVVFLKQLSKSGLLLVTGPLRLNSMPLRRISSAYVIATKTKIDISGVSVPEHIDDAYFRRTSRKKAAEKSDTSIFADGTPAYKVSKKRKADQKLVDKQILEIIQKHPERKFMFGYLGSKFCLGKNQFPHQMIF